MQIALDAFVQVALVKIAFGMNILPRMQVTFCISMLPWMQVALHASYYDKF